MIQLGPVSFQAIQHWLVDFQKRSKHYEIPSDDAQLLGIFSDGVLAGYFIVTGYEDGDLEITQGYLTSEFRHKNLSCQAMALLEHKAKAVGYKKIILASSRTLRAYTDFMKVMGYSPERIIFSKEI